MKTVASVMALSAALLSTGLAQAEKPRPELAALVGWGTPAFNSSYNNFGPGAGIRGGVAVGALWIGATTTYQLGQTSGWNDYSSGAPVSQQWALAVFAGGGEIGANIRFSHVVLRPYVWAGALVYMQSPLATGTPPEAPADPIVRFAVAPSIHVDYELARGGWFFGGDVRVNLLVPGTAPRVRGCDCAVMNWTDAEHFTGEVSVFGVVGKRF